MSPMGERGEPAPAWATSIRFGEAEQQAAAAPATLPVSRSARSRFISKASQQKLIVKVELELVLSGLVAAATSSPPTRLLS